LDDAQASHVVLLSWLHLRVEHRCVHHLHSLFGRSVAHMNPHTPGSPVPVEALKPDTLKDYKTVIEVCRIIKRDKKVLTRLEKNGRIPSPIRVKRGMLQVRLYSPTEVEQIKKYLEEHPSRHPATGRGFR
jgi:hypothetical protein